MRVGGSRDRNSKTLVGIMINRITLVAYVASVIEPSRGFYKSERPITDQIVNGIERTPN